MYVIYSYFKISPTSLNFHMIYNMTLVNIVYKQFINWKNNVFLHNSYVATYGNL
jgi:hypothetical protein